jgi:hypothetical protein
MKPKGRGSITRKAKGVKRIENLEKRAKQAQIKVNRRRAYAQAQATLNGQPSPEHYKTWQRTLNGQPSPEHYKTWQRTHFHLNAVERQYWRKQKEILETTSLKDLIK